MKTQTSVFRRMRCCTARLPGYTPVEAPGAKTIRTAELCRCSPRLRHWSSTRSSNSWGRRSRARSGSNSPDLGGSFADEAQDRLRRKMAELTGGDLGQPVRCGRLELRAL